MGESLKAANELAGAEKFYLAALANQQGPYSERRARGAQSSHGIRTIVAD